MFDHDIDKLTPFNMYMMTLRKLRKLGCNKGSTDERAISFGLMFLVLDQLYEEHANQPTQTMHQS